MKVRELIKELLEQPMDLEVIVLFMPDVKFKDIHYIHNNKVQNHIEVVTYSSESKED